MAKIARQEEVAAAACALCSAEVTRGTLFPSCVCGEPLGCQHCQGQGTEVRCRACRRETNLMPYWRSISRAFHGKKGDTPGLVRFTPNGMAFICEGDGMFRACRIDRLPLRRKVSVNELGAYLDAEGNPLWPEEWEPEATGALELPRHSMTRMEDGR